MPIFALRYPAAYTLAAIVLAPIAARAGSETVVYSFKGEPDGANPLAGLTNAGGTLYGTTYYGGIGHHCLNGGPPGYGTCGTAFSLTSDGTESVIYSFGQPHGWASPGSAYAAFPNASLIYVDGALYGTALGGTEFPDHAGDGTAFKLTPSGTEKLLLSFPEDEAMNANGLVKLGHTFFGTTEAGGYGGTVFSMTPAGKLNVLYSFQGGRDGQFPSANLINVGGTLYGVTYSGGTGCDGHGCGTLFAVTPAGEESLVYSFGQSIHDGANPDGALISFNGRIYGTTSEGGGKGCGGGGCGTVFSMTPDGVETVLHRFRGGNDGTAPHSSLLRVGDKLYGTTSAGGEYGYGTVFRVSLTGTEKVVHAFGASADGRGPSAGLIKLGGALYGTTASGGANGQGTVFKIVP
jgi:uncharacterized repeat protein (TIGR03803 family)